MEFITNNILNAAARANNSEGETSFLNDIAARVFQKNAIEAEKMLDMY